jgi:hypothetical protein
MMCPCEYTEEGDPQDKGVTRNGMSFHAGVFLSFPFNGGRSRGGVADKDSPRSASSCAPTSLQTGDGVEELFESSLENFESYSRDINVEGDTNPFASDTTVTVGGMNTLTVCLLATCGTHHVGQLLHYKAFLDRGASLGLAWIKPSQDRGPSHTLPSQKVPEGRGKSHHRSNIANIIAFE